MDSSAAQGLAMFGVVGTLFAFLLAVLWILVPFAIFGIKPLLRDLIHHQKRANDILFTIATQADAAAVQATQTITDPTSPAVVADTRTLGEIMQKEGQPMNANQ